ncbi:MAG: hypothetical protein AAGA08_05165 [Pseudomonadota bacterium]
MRQLSVILAYLLSLLAASPLVAAVEVCNRVTHISHGGSDSHRDMGAGMVMWIDWWAQEGVFKDVWLADCKSGTALSLRTWEERITDRHVIDRTEKALRIIDRQAEAAPAFFTLDRVAELVRKQGVDLNIAAHANEFCACAVAYPSLRGDKTPYEEER